MRIPTAASLLSASLFVALALAAPAAAKTVSYTGEGVNVKSGQTRGLPVYVGFELIGRGCPTGPHCLDHAKVQAIEAVDWAYPNCLEVLDGEFEINKHSPRPVSHKSHTFSASGISEHYSQTHVTFSGRFLRGGKANGWFEVEEAPCATGRIHWVAEPD
jgi:hypothetical protein